MTFSIKYTDELKVFYGDDILNATLATKDMIFHGEIEVVLEGEKRDYIKVTDIISINDKELDYTDIARINGIDTNNYHARLRVGWSKIRAATEKVDAYRTKNQKGA